MLTDTWLKKAKIEDGIWGDGAGLYLRVKGSNGEAGSGNRSWFYIYRSVDNRRREMGLGSGHVVSLKQARTLRDKARDLLIAGIDPVEERRASRARVVIEERVKTFEDVALEWIEAGSAGQVWGRNVATRYEGYVRKLVKLRGIGVGDVGKADVVEALRPVWGTPTGDYLRSFIERVLDYAVAKGLVGEGLNPARMKGNIDVLMPRGRCVRTHHDALPWQEVGGVYRRLGDCERSGGSALRMLILGGFRQREVRELRWCDIRPDRIVIVGSRYKTRRDHAVPLSDAMRDVLASLVRGEPDEYVFKGHRQGIPLSSHAFERLLDDLGADCVPHGFRTSFAVWCVEAGGFSDDIAQRCLGHVVGTEVSRAYQRSDFFEAKKACLQAWGEFVAG